MQGRIVIALLVAAGFAVKLFAAEQTLQNDSFVQNGEVAFQAGFVAGEVAEARFVPQIPCSCTIE